MDSAPPPSITREGVSAVFAAAGLPPHVIQSVQWYQRAVDGADCERLQFVGGSLLHAIVAVALCEGCSDATTVSELTAMRTRVLCADVLVAAADRVGLPRVGGVARRLAARRLASFVGAIHADLSYAVAERFVRSLLRAEIADAIVRGHETCAKDRLTKRFQRQYRSEPSFRVVREGAADAPVYDVEVIHVDGKRVLGRARASRKRDAENAAAAQALDNFFLHI